MVDGDRIKNTKQSYPWCPELLIKQDSKKVRIGIDLQDWENYFSRHSVKRCDMIYKRALNSESKSKYESVLSAQLRPFGPNHNAVYKDKRVDAAINTSARRQNIVKAYSNPLKVFKKLRGKSLKHGGTTTAHAYPDLDPPKDPYVFFQVQCHTWGNNSFASGLNEFRAELIRKFRKEFGSRFVGGMFFNGSIDPDYEDCITDVNPTPENYKRFVQNASVLISTNGFGDSIPWKLTEYLNWGSCIVSQKPEHLFRDPVPESAMRQFTTVDEAIDLVQSLLDNPEERVLMSKAAADYYQQSVKPSTSVWAVVQDALTNA